MVERVVPEVVQRVIEEKISNLVDVSTARATQSLEYPPSPALPEIISGTRKHRVPRGKLSGTVDSALLQLFEGERDGSAAIMFPGCWTWCCGIISDSRDLKDPNCLLNFPTFRRRLATGRSYRHSASHHRWGQQEPKHLRQTPSVIRSRTKAWSVA